MEDSEYAGRQGQAYLLGRVKRRRTGGSRRICCVTAPTAELKSSLRPSCPGPSMIHKTPPSSADSFSPYIKPLRVTCIQCALLLRSSFLPPFPCQSHPKADRAVPCNRRGRSTGSNPKSMQLRLLWLAARPRADTQHQYSGSHVHGNYMLQ